MSLTLTCPMCREEWIFTTRICDECDTIRHYMEIYSRDKILEILDKVLVVQQHKEKEQPPAEESKTQTK